MFEFNIKGYLACNNTYYYSSSNPVDIIVYAENVNEAYEKADSIVGYIHRRTSHYTAKEIIGSSLEEEMFNCARYYMKGASDCMKYMHDYYNGAEPIYPSEMEDIFIKFVEQFGELKND